MISFEDLEQKRSAVAVVGLGYVGLPLAVAMAKYFKVTGFDISADRVAELGQGRDRTSAISASALKDVDITFSSDPCSLSQAAVIIVAVPTPITSHREPDLSPLFSATEIVGQHMSKGCIVVYESTVYPGVTEEECRPILESVSGLQLGRDFFLGYSPERINPGDQVHTVEKITKIVAGSTPEVADLLAALYGKVIAAGIFRASSIRVAEAAKVIENTQRDLNIALMNELALIFDRLGLDTLEVLEAAGTKWNFLPFRPGLVGGHCIGVDPYYLTYKAEDVGYHPQVILAGRRINDGMGKFIAEKAVKLLVRNGRPVHSAKVGIFGLAFKENVSDLRNTRVVDIYQELQEYGINALVYDPLAVPEEAAREYGIRMASLEHMQTLDALIVAVGHDEFIRMDLLRLREIFADPTKGILLDVKGLWKREDAEASGITYWRL